MASTATSQASAKYDLFVFGDSLSDIGNLYQKTNQTFPPSPPNFNGRLTNGAVAVENLAQQLGLPISLNTDFAIVGARTDRTNVLDNGNFKPGGLLDEIDQFKANATNLGAGAEDIYVVWAGANDFLKLLSTPPADPATVISEGVKNIVSSVNTLIASGAKNILVAELPNLGLTPLLVSKGQDQVKAITNLTQQFNAALITALNGIKSSAPNSNIILSDTFKASNAVAANPSAFGFTNITDSLLKNLPVPNPSEYFFWDDFHPTTQGHNVFANLFHSDLVNGITDAIDRKG
ncbi:MAG TPA: SGNH/GDSL hydrolase family protein, partial [Allocoleopsis sp.]